MYLTWIIIIIFFHILTPKEGLFKFLFPLPNQIWKFQFNLKLSIE